jgi:3-methyladenine DNA glycosylase AlkD
MRAKTMQKHLDPSTLRKYLNEISQKLASLSRPKLGNHYNSPTITLGLTVPQSRSALKSGYSFLSMPPDEVVRVWDFIWHNSSYFEEMSQAIYFYEKKSLSENEFKTVATWINRCDNWAHSDGLSSIYARVLEENPEMVFPVLQEWNRDVNPWKRRQSVVSLLYYSRLRKKTLPFSTLISLLIPLFKDPEYYVQKGLGWTIREIYNLHPELTLDFISSNLHEISPAAWQASTEKLPSDCKKDLLTRRTRR